mgnify:CR=1 FL=1
MVTDLEDCVIAEENYSKCNITLSTMETMMTVDYNSTASMVTDALSTTVANFIK